MAESTLGVIGRRRKLMEDAAVLEGDGVATDQATKPWRQISVDNVKDNSKQTLENPDEKPHLRKSY